MSDDQFSEERGRALLAQAFEQCEIPERTGDEYPPKLFGTGNVYSETTDSDIQIVFSYYHANAGPVYCSISLRRLAFQTAQGYKNDEEAIEALVDTLKYLESAVSGLLPTAQHKLLRRVFNLKVRGQTSKEQQKGWITILEQIAPSDTRTETEKKLAAERDWRGGSDPRLEVSDKQCEQMSTDYQTLLRHWQKINRSRKKEKNWRAYAKIDQPDTPEDLLDRLDDKLPSEDESEGSDYPNIPSAIAHEHAARRVGIKANEYSLSRLKDFRQRGDSLRGQSKSDN